MPRWWIDLAMAFNGLTWRLWRRRRFMKRMIQLNALGRMMPPGSRRVLDFGDKDYEELI